MKETKRKVCIKEKLVYGSVIRKIIMLIRELKIYTNFEKCGLE